MANHTVDNTMANLTYEISEREIYNDVRSEIGVSTSETVIDADPTYSWKVWHKYSGLPAPGYTIYRYFTATVATPLDWKVQNVSVNDWDWNPYYDYEYSLEDTDDSLTKAKDAFFTRKSKSSGTAYVADVAGSNSVETYVVNTFREARGNTNLRNRLVAMANAHYFANRTDISDGRFDELDEVLQSEIDAAYVKDDMIVAEDGTNMTMYPLSLTTGGMEDEFADYVRAEMKKNSTDPSINWDQVDFKLVPVGHNEMDKGMTYGVVIVDENGTRQMQDIAYPFADPRETDPVVVPAFFSTNEAGFYQVKQGLKRGQEMTAGPIATRERVTGEVRNDLAFAIEPNKYNRILDKVPSIADDYRNLNRGSPDTILRTIAIIRNQIQVLDDPLAKEMIVDLNEMQAAVEAGLEEIRVRTKDAITAEDIKTASPFGGFGL